jgi:cyanophycinase
MADAGEHDTVCMLGMTIHVLIAGATFNMQTRHASAGTLATPKQTS